MGPLSISPSPWPFTREPGYKLTAGPTITEIFSYFLCLEIYNPNARIYELGREYSNMFPD
jgi:hypothetical protein